MKLSDHFTLEELCESETAMRKGIDNTLPDDLLPNLRLLAAGLERVRYVLRLPMYISSGYRSPELNKAIGGSANSAHMQGLAADFVCPGYGTPYQIVERLMRDDSFVLYDKLIYEGKWVHIAFTDGVAKKEVLTAHFGKGGATYSPGLA